MEEINVKLTKEEINLIYIQLYARVNVFKEELSTKTSQYDENRFNGIIGMIKRINDINEKLLNSL